MWLIRGLLLLADDERIGTYGRERAIRPNKLYLIEEKGVIASLCAFAVSNSLHGKFPRIAGTGTFGRESGAYRLDGREF
jgi:hypothetical protein